MIMLTAGCTSHNHSHSDHDGHDHSEDKKEKTSHSSDHIVFTEQQAESAGLETETVKPAAFNRIIKTGGQISTTQGGESIITATTSGLVSFANPSLINGISVRAGETVVTVSARKILDGDPADKAVIDYRNAVAEYERARSLVSDQIISAKEFEQIKLRYETAKNAYDAQAENITANGVKITSPITGYIKNILVSQGEYVSVGQPIATITKNNKLQLKAEVSEKYFNLLKTVSGANFKMAYDDKVYRLSDLNGRLMSYGKTTDQDSFYIPVIFEFDNDGDIIPGSFAEVYLLGHQTENTISIPKSSLTEEQGIYFVYLKIADDEYRKQEITPGQDNGDRVQILAGLHPGDEVVTRGAYQIKLASVSSLIPEGHTHLN